MTAGPPIHYRTDDGRTHTIDQLLVERRAARIEGDTRAIVALDVDGVINALDPPADAGWEMFDVTLPAQYLPDSAFVRGHGRSDLSVRLHMHPIHRLWIVGLEQRAELIWATTWGDAANAVIAALHQLPRPLPVLDLQGPTHVSAWRDAIAAKTEALRVYAAGRPVVFIDDHAPNWWINGDGLGGRSLAVAPDPKAGLTAAGLHQVSVFLDWAQTATADDRYRIGYQPSPGRWAIDTDAGDHIELLCGMSAQEDDQLGWRDLKGVERTFSNFNVRVCQIGNYLDVVAHTAPHADDEEGSGVGHAPSTVNVGQGRVTRITAQLLQETVY